MNEVRLRLVGDGTVTGTRLETDDGRVVQDVVYVSWVCDAEQRRHQSVAVVIIRPLAVDLTVPAMIVEKAG